MDPNHESRLVDSETITSKSDFASDMADPPVPVEGETDPIVVPPIEFRPFFRLPAELRLMVWKMISNGQSQNSLRENGGPPKGGLPNPELKRFKEDYHERPKD